MALALFLLPSVALGLLLTAHVALVMKLLSRTPRWRSVVALVVPPLAPYWGYEERFRVWSGVWLFAFALYALGFALASSGT